MEEAFKKLCIFAKKARQEFYDLAEDSDDSDDSDESVGYNSEDDDGTPYGNRQCRINKFFRSSKRTY